MSNSNPELRAKMTAEMTSDPRVFFAAERTLLAWVRTGITLMVLGFVVARFGLFLSLLANTSITNVYHMPNHWLSNALGFSLILTGSMTIILSQFNHHYYVKTLPIHDIPTRPITWLTAFLAVAVSLVGLLLAAYIAIV